MRGNLLLMIIDDIHHLLYTTLMTYELLTHIYIHLVFTYILHPFALTFASHVIILK